VGLRRESIGKRPQRGNSTSAPKARTLLPGAVSWTRTKDPVARDHGMHPGKLCVKMDRGRSRQTSSTCSAPVHSTRRQFVLFAIWFPSADGQESTRPDLRIATVKAPSGRTLSFSGADRSKRGPGCNGARSSGASYDCLRCGSLMGRYGTESAPKPLSSHRVLPAGAAIFGPAARRRPGLTRSATRRRATPNRRAVSQESIILGHASSSSSPPARTDAGPPSAPKPCRSSCAMNTSMRVQRPYRSKRIGSGLVSTGTSQPVS
jgi:hypothetical protein